MKRIFIRIIISLVVLIILVTRPEIYFLPFTCETNIFIPEICYRAGSVRWWWRKLRKLELSTARGRNVYLLAFDFQSFPLNLLPCLIEINDFILINSPIIAIVTKL